MFKIKNKTTFSLMLLFSIFALSAAYYIQYVLKHEPCNLCLIARIPYIISIIIILTCLFTKRFEKLSLIILSIVLNARVLN